MNQKTKIVFRFLDEPLYVELYMQTHKVVHRHKRA